MSTTYYAVKTEPTCNNPIPIARSVNGWCGLKFFATDLPFYDLKLSGYLWIKHVVEEGKYMIMNEYDEHIPWEKFEEMIKKDLSEDDMDES